MENDVSQGKKVPVAIHFIALFYIVQALLILGVFVDTRKQVSSSLIHLDIITLSLLLIPLVAILSIYKPNRYLRWFPFYGILLNWVVIIGIGNYMLNIDWLTDPKSLSEAAGFVGGMMTLFFLFEVTIWMLIPALLMYANQSTKTYILQRRSDIADKNA